MQFLTQLLILLLLATSSMQAKQNPTKINARRQLILYDPRSGRQLQPLAFRAPGIFTGNKRKPSQANGNLIELPQLWNPCSCTEFLCICCLGLQLGEGILNQRVCVTLQYNSAQILLKLSLTVNQRNIASFDIPASNPAPWCVPMILPLPVYACLRLYDIRALDGNVHICISLMINAASNQLLQFPFDCVRFGASGIAFLPPTNAESSSVTNTHSFDADENGATDNGGEGAVVGGQTDGSEVRESIQLEENYSGISVEVQRPQERRSRG